MDRTRKVYKLGLAVLAGIVITFTSCDPEAPASQKTSAYSYNRKKMLSNMASNYIIPAYNAYHTATKSLVGKVISFNAAPNDAALKALRLSWEHSLLVWQDVGFLEFGPAKENVLLAQTNVYPVDTSEINTNIKSGNFNLKVPKNFDSKGFQALDYLVNGVKSTSEKIVDFYVATPNARTYMLKVAEELNSNAQKMVNSWANYQNKFVNNSSSNAVGSSVSAMFNAFVQYYERDIRKAKIGLPVGVFNQITKTPMPRHVEAVYFSKSLPFLHRALIATHKFFSGKNYTSGNDGEGLDNYLKYINATANGQPLQLLIQQQFDKVKQLVGTINDPLSEQVVMQKSLIEQIYEELQKLVPQLKVQTSDQLEIPITYQDTDGD